jgi:hypothetical protein
MEGIPAPDVADYKRRKEIELGLAAGSISQPQAKRPKIENRVISEDELRRQLEEHKALMGLNNPEPPSVPESTSGAVYAAPQTYAAPPVPLAPGIPSGPPVSTQYPPVPPIPSTVPSVPPAFPPPFAPGIPLGFVSFLPLCFRSPFHRFQTVLLPQVFRCLHLWVYRLACCHRSIPKGFLEDHHFRLLDSFPHQ